MITIENGFEETHTIIIDPTGQLEDIEVIATDKGWFIRQFDENMGGYDLIEFSFDTFKMFLTSLQLPEGIYTLEVK